MPKKAAKKVAGRELEKRSANRPSTKKGTTNTGPRRTERPSK